MLRTRLTSAAVFTLLLLPSCSFIIDTNPDGVIAAVGGSGIGKAGSGSSGDTSSMGGTGASGGAQTLLGGATSAGTAGNATVAEGGSTTIIGAGGFNTSGATTSGLGGVLTTSAGNSGVAGSIAAGGVGTSGAAPVGSAPGSSGATSVGGAGADNGGASAGGSTSTTGGVAGNGGKATGGVALSVGGVATGGVATGGVATGGAATGGATTAPCPGTAGPVMVRLPAGYCIDSTEVTRSQYAAWLASTTAATVNSQDPTICGWNTTFVPSGDYADYSQVCKDPGCGNHPQTSVDWCDAVAYCKGVGKRLCGKIGGGSVEQGQQDNAAVSQWYNACSSGGANTYAYGNTHLPKQCNGQDYFGIGADGTDYTKTVPVASLSGCQPNVPYAGVWDLNGNAGEWEDACLPGYNSIGDFATVCMVRGGSYGDANTDGMIDCSMSGRGGLSAYARDDIYHSRGFRCCAE